MSRRITTAVLATLVLVSPAALLAQKEPATKDPAVNAVMPTALANRAIVTGGAVVATTCTDSNGTVPNVTGQKFVDPLQLTAQNQTLTVNLDVKQVSAAVPTLDVNGNCVMQSLSLREFGVNAANYGFPGPTFVLNKASLDGTTPGDRLVVNLSNSLSKSHEDCIQADTPQCVCPSASTSQPQCCLASNTLPDCFHGNNTTNLHFHGLHVSPQSPQDYVLLELEPAGTTAKHAPHSAKGTTAVGQFQYAVNALPENQAPGTYWYHPHKHGSTALQVGNGMAGAILVRGEFDTQLQKLFSVPLTEHVMIVQYIHDLNFTQATTTTPVPLVNGLYQPVVTMQAGEIQRWRFVGATMEGSAQISIDFNGPTNTGLTAMQITMDGVQFSPKNYLCQPLLQAKQVTQPCSLQPVADPVFNLSPGNRADFLVQAPSQPGTYGTTYAIFGNTDRQGTGQAQGGPRGRGKRQPTVENVKKVLKLFAPGASAPALLTVNVVPCTDRCGMTYPASLPELPQYLQNIPSTTDGNQVVQFRLDIPGGGIGKTGQQPQMFGIAVQGQNGGDTQQFNGQCANFTEPLNRTETWTISQNINSPSGSAFHVFHMHTNLFQLVSSGTADGSGTIIYPDPIWMDSITLPNNTAGTDGFPTSPTIPNSPNSTVVIRQRFKDYTGAYVLHCHFLGHEDLGMMLMVQTVCPNAKDEYGQVQANGGADNCTICGGTGSPCPKALPRCTASLKKSATSQHEHKKKQ
jgi:FtsP/CotA-like multicopper oxidase with cupredoxin domain